MLDKDTDLTEHFIRSLLYITQLGRRILFTPARFSS